MYHVSVVAYTSVSTTVCEDRLQVHAHAHSDITHDSKDYMHRHSSNRAPIFYWKGQERGAESKDSKGQMELAMPRGRYVFALEYQGLPPRGWLGPIRGFESAKI